MTRVKVWCEECHGTGIDRLKQLQGRTDYGCDTCNGKGYKEWTIEQLQAPADAYTSSDADVDAKVLESIGPYVREVPHDKEPPIANAIASAIMRRLHAFYCGGTK